MQENMRENDLIGLILISYLISSNSTKVMQLKVIVRGTQNEYMKNKHNPQTA